MVLQSWEQKILVFKWTLQTQAIRKPVAEKVSSKLFIAVIIELGYLLVYPVFGMCLGVPDQDPGIKPRMPLDLIVSTDTYKEMDSERLKDYDQQVSAYYIERTKGKVNHTWTEQISDKMKSETRPFMKQFLNAQGLARK